MNAQELAAELAAFGVTEQRCIFDLVAAEYARLAAPDEAGQVTRG